MNEMVENVTASVPNGTAAAVVGAVTFKDPKLTDPTPTLDPPELPELVPPTVVIGKPTIVLFNMH